MSTPALNEHTFEKINCAIDESIPAEASVMTLNGTINKSLILLSSVILTSLITYKFPLPAVVYWAVILIALIVGIIICYKPHKAPTLSPVYAVLEGLSIGSLSGLVDRVCEDHIAIQAVLCTLAVVFAMLAAYRFGIIQVNKTFRTILHGAVYGVLLYYTFLIFTSLCGLYIAPLYCGTWAMVIDLIICGIAAFCLAEDFDNIRIGIESQAPKWVEWYCSYALMVTIIWIYLQILRLLASRRR